MCPQGTYGPFRPNIPVEVPMYLALALNRRNKCRIQPPAWMAREKLKGEWAEGCGWPGASRYRTAGGT
jgi:hypothetical protein